MAAGEMTFCRERGQVFVAEVSNQSTGYCPEPESWAAVDQVLTVLHTPHPSQFTCVFHFRRCDACEAINVIKDGVFECAVCDAPLSERWNFGLSD